MKIAKIVNKFGNKFNVPLHKAREMQMNGEIDEFETFEIDASETKNTEAPMTQAQFENALEKPKKTK